MSFRLSDDLLSYKLNEHSKLRELRRNELMNSSYCFQFNPSLTSLQSHVSLSLSKIHSDNVDNVLDGLNSLKVLVNENGDDILSYELLNQLVSLLGNAIPSIVMNVISLLVNISTTSNEEVLSMLFTTGIVTRLLYICNQSITTTNHLLLDLITTTLGNIIFNNQQYCESVIKSGYVSTILQFATFVSSLSKYKYQSYPTLASDLLPLCISYLQLYNGGITNNILETIKNISLCYPELIKTMIRCSELHQIFIMLMKTNRYDCQELIVSIIQIWCKTYSKTYKCIDQFVLTILQIIPTTHQVVLPLLYTFLFSLVVNESYHSHFIKLIFEHNTTLNFVLNCFNHSLFNISSSAIRLICGLCIYTKDSIKIIEWLVDHLFIETIVCCLQKKSICMNPSILSLMLQSIESIFFYCSNPISIFETLQGNAVLNALLSINQQNISRIKSLQSYLINIDNHCMIMVN
ncbi:Uncharacterized protein QTN25_001724 [Entamoeba marina]